MMHGHTVPANTYRTVWASYECSVRKSTHKEGCCAPSLSALALEQSVLDVILREVITRANLRPLADELVTYFSTQHTELTTQLNTLKAQIAEKERAIQKLLGLIESDSMLPSTPLPSRLKEREKEKTELVLEKRQLDLSPVRTPSPEKLGVGVIFVAPRIIWIGLVLCLVSASGSSVNAAVPSALRDALPDSLCALVSAQVVCYDAQTAGASPATPANQKVIDFALSPEGQWLAYRTSDFLAIAAIDGSINGNGAQVIDPNAAPPADINPGQVTIAWSPDGLGIAYLSSLGLRVAYPNGHFYNATDRPYANLKWSPGGTRLAVQSDDGTWTFFACSPDAPLRTMSVYSQAADIAWLGDTIVIVAPVAGGLLRIDPVNAAAPVWTVADEHFINLQTAADNKIVALHPDPGDIIGNAVAIPADGNWTPLGDAKLDSRLQWGPAGQMLLYITSGTPILVDRVTGYEDMLPLRRISRIVWASPPPPESMSVMLDADLYFLAADSSGTTQLWRLSRNNFPLLVMTQSVQSITAYTLYNDTIQYTAGGMVTTVRLDGSSIPTVTPSNTLSPRATALRTPIPTPTPRPTLPPPSPLPPAGSLQNVGWQPGPTVVQRTLKNGSQSSAYLLENAILSPTGKFAVGYRSPHGKVVVLNWETGREITLRDIPTATAFQWGR